MNRFILLYKQHEGLRKAVQIIRLVFQHLSRFKQDISTYCFAAMKFSSTFALRFGGRGLVKRIKKKRFERLKRSKRWSLFVFTGKGKQPLETAKNKKKKRKINS